MPFLIVLVLGMVTVVAGRTLIASSSSTTAHPAPPPHPTQQEEETRYPLRALLRVSVDVDVDGSKQHMQRLFPGVEGKLGSELSFRVPLEHPWFGEATLTWKNARAGKLRSVKLDRPVGDDKFKNQRAIADCLTKGLGKPDAHESNHLAGEWSYFWREPSRGAGANLYPLYFWLEFEEPLTITRRPLERTGAAPGQPLITVKRVLSTLDSCVTSP